jgi:hypothetical protein
MPNDDIPVKLPMMELKALLREAKRTIPAGTLWQHYGGERYWVIGHTIDKNQNFVRVVYVPEDQKGLPDQVPFDCPLQEWREPLQTERFTGERFTKVSD